MILVDSREPKSCIDLGIQRFGEENIKIDTLLTGDVLVNGLCIERKRIDDLISSVIDGRLKEQCYNMTAYDMAFIIIEGELEYLRNSDPRFRKYTQKWLYGLIFSIMMNYGIYVLQVKTNKDFWKAVERCKFKHEHRKKIEKSQIYTPKLSSEYKKSIPLSMLCCIPGISESKAALILEQFSLYQLYNIPKEDLLTIDGIGPVIAAKIKSEFRGD